MKKTLFLPVFLFLPAILLVNGCSTKPQSMPTPSQNQSAGQNSLQANPQPSSGNQTASEEIKIQNFAFLPPSLTIKKGETITWTNEDSAPHQIASDTNIFQGPAISKGQTYSFTFNDTGTFPYHCAIHPSMKGIITVQ